MSLPTQTLMIYLNLLKIQSLRDKLCNNVLHTTPPINLSQIMIRLCGTHSDRISWAMNFLHDLLLDFVHPWYTQSTLIPRHTISPFFKSLYFFAYEQWSPIQEICFSFTSDIKDNSTNFTTTTPLSEESIRWTPRRASLRTSFASSYISSAKYVVLPIDNLLKASSTTVALPQC